VWTGIIVVLNVLSHNLEAVLLQTLDHSSASHYTVTRHTSDTANVAM
jgi:hypothetical protein